MDIRVYPYPPDTDIISEAGSSFVGWGLSVELDGKVSSITIQRGADAEQVARRLDRLAGMLRSTS